ncbi:UNVERIFIED_CONTAM: hypothetical protein H355_005562 [Colinus virginianus]|nr:hypothetical protein H355_005562 [Colinus virginianus]
MRPAAPLAALLVLAALTAAALLLVLAPARLLPVRTKYGLVFDAGSTHTALYVYRWPADKENGTGIVSQVQSCTANGSGISSYADDPAGAGASLKPCLDKAMTVIPVEQQRETPTYLGATAGMRLLREQNSTKAEQVFAEVTKAIREYPVDFRGAQILTGNEEGAFGWITVNYLLETLIKVWGGERAEYSFSGKWTHPPMEDVVGALDLGGASTQITFLPGTTTDDKNTTALLRLYGTNYSVYTHSYLCYGQKQVLKRLLASLHQDSPDPQQISHPCYPRGYRENVTTAELYNSPCVPTLSTPSPAQVLMLQKDFPTRNKIHLRDSCAASSYVLTLLLQGYKFDDKTWLNIHFQKQVSNVDVGWTLGYMLNLTNMIPSETPQRAAVLPKSKWVAATVILAIILILIFCLITALCYWKDSSGYETL